jgi:uncharacterized protein
MFKRLLASPVFVRVFPFAVFAGLTLVQGWFGDASQYWIYVLKTALAGCLLCVVRPYVQEMHWRISWRAVLVGIFVFVAWIGLERYYPLFATRAATFNPEQTYGSGSPLACAFIAVRILGSSLIVPPLEEIFYRSFLYRYFIKSDFLQIPLCCLEWRAFLITGLVFGIGHYEWLPGILCAFAYQGLVCRTNRVGDAITAHGITNFLLGLWVVIHQAYHYW